MSRSRWLLPCLVAVLLSGCAGASEDVATSDPTSDSTPTQTTPPSPSEVVAAVDVGPGDLPGEYGSTNRFGRAGDLVDGYVTLDLCGAVFASEELRTARHRVAYSAPDGASISTETVAYESDGAELAMSELRGAVADCPKGFFAYDVGEQPAIKVRIEELPDEVDWQEDTLAMAITLTPKGEPAVSGALIYQRRDDVLTAAYAWAGPESSSALAVRVASLLSERLTAASVGSTS